ncbi:MAG: Gmad2 immunoglobulin-like domain-containing protein [bacterium]|nr:Gmad2 immunoglobulin-like domain-containing protein [bacterium]
MCIKTFLIVLTFLAVGVSIFFLSTGFNSTDSSLTDLIRVDAPVSNALVSSPLIISGSARGSWYFEASFPVQLLDANGGVLFEGPMQAQGDWMTSEFVPFNQQITFALPKTQTGTLVLKNDNPSGLPENDKELRIPVKFQDFVYPITKEADFGAKVVLNVGDGVTFGNRLPVSLSKIDDSRCKPGVQCIWAGELSALLIVTELGAEVRLGTVNNTSVTKLGYTFELLTATEKSATIVVTQTSVTNSSGMTGYVHVGPTCPVERVPADPKCADKPLVDAEVLIKKASGGQIVESLTTDDSGKFRVALIPGEYAAEVKIGASAMPSCPVNTFRVITGEYTSIDVACDSGIR